MKVFLVRHPEVARAWAGRCYGQSDMGWSRAGAAAAIALADRLVALKPTVIIHSDLLRTRRLAEGVGHRLGVTPLSDTRWRERCFGAWEGRRWNSIWRETGNEMDHMVSDPVGYRPGGGETTAEMGARAARAWCSLPIVDSVVVIAHGGPIAAIRTMLAGGSYSAILAFIPTCGEVVELIHTVAVEGSSLLSAHKIATCEGSPVPHQA